MELFGRIIFGSIGIVLGALITIKHAWILQNFGYIATIERKMGSFGGTRMFYILFGVFISVSSLLYITGVFPGIFTNAFLGALGR